MIKIKNIKDVGPLKKFSFGSSETGSNPTPIIPIKIKDNLKDDLKDIVEIFEFDSSDGDYYINNNRLNEKLEPGFNADKYNEELKNVLSNAKGTRNKVASAAIFLATKFPQLPYFWGGSHELSSIDDMKGINSKWGSNEVCQFGGAEPFYEMGKQYPYSLDCSGFTSWCLVNAGFKDIDRVWNTTDFYESNKTEVVSITDSSVIERVQVGDFGYNNHHIGVVIDVDKDNHEITFAHVSGDNGMNITTMSTETGLITKDNTGNSNINRVGNDYFTDILLMDYSD